MPDLLEMLQLRWEHLLGRAGGPLHFRLMVMPMVVTFFAVRAGLRDARAGKPGFVWKYLAEPDERRQLIRSALKDIGKILIVATVLDTIYQTLVYKSFYPGELLLVVFVSAVLPYILFRGPIAFIVRFIQKRKQDAALRQEHVQVWNRQEKEKESRK